MRNAIPESVSQTQSRLFSLDEIKKRISISWVDRRTMAAHEGISNHNSIRYEYGRGTPRRVFLGGSAGLYAYVAFMRTLGIREEEPAHRVTPCASPVHRCQGFSRCVLRQRWLEKRGEGGRTATRRERRALSIPGSFRLSRAPSFRDE